MLIIRPATIQDVPVIRGLILELARYERQVEQVRTTEADLVRAGFSPRPEFRALIAEWDGVAAGFAVFFSHYSTWRGAGLYVEDLFVRTELRGRGIGKALLAQVAGVAEREKRVFIRWAVLDWNQPAIGLYGKLGADFLDEWRTVLLTGESLKRLAGKRPFAEARSLRCE